MQAKGDKSKSDRITEGELSAQSIFKPNVGDDGAKLAAAEKLLLA